MAIQSDAELLLSKIRMYLASGAGDKQGRQLLEEAERQIKYSWNNERMERLCERMEMICNGISAGAKYHVSAPDISHYPDFE